jgi:hypothetical protein
MTSASEDGASQVLERTLRTSPVTGIRVDSVLTAVLISELLDPSPDLWLVSAWISDVPAVDNSRGDYDSLIIDASARVYQLSEILGQLTRQGTHLIVVTRNVPENGSFLARLDWAVEDRRSHVIHGADAHEKTFCGKDWLLSGSMNFTVNGMAVNDEAVTYRLDRGAAAQARLDLKHRWGTHEPGR